MGARALALSIQTLRMVCLHEVVVCSVQPPPRLSMVFVKFLCPEAMVRRLFVECVVCYVEGT